MTKIWRLQVKEKDNPHVICSTYHGDERTTEEDMIKFWGLEEPEVEWYKLTCEDAERP